MNNTPLTNLSPLDGRYAEKLTALRDIGSEYGLMKYRVQVEIQWLIKLAQTDEITECPAFSKNDLNTLENIFKDFSIEDAEQIKTFEKTTNHDVKAVEYFIKARIKEHPTFNNLSEFVHFACTSEDINNLAYGLMLKDLRHLMVSKLQSLCHTLEPLIEHTKTMPLLALTHGQPASPTTVGKELKNVLARFKRQISLLERQPILGKINGAVGNYNAHCVAYPNVDWLNLSKAFVETLGLAWNPHTTQIEPHDGLAEMLDNLARINTCGIDFSQDMWGYIARGVFKQRHNPDETGSSTMPHKVNPIDFENAEGNFGLANALASHMARKLPCSRFQRDLTDSTVLRHLGSVFGFTYLACTSLEKGLTKVEPDKTTLETDLDQAWEVLGEAIQTVMRRHQLNGAYEQLKTLSRGQGITQEKMQTFIENLDIPEASKKALLALSPSSYTGYAVHLCDFN